MTSSRQASVLTTEVRRLPGFIKKYNLNSVMTPMLRMEPQKQTLLTIIILCTQGILLSVKLKSLCPHNDSPGNGINCLTEQIIIYSRYGHSPSLDINAITVLTLIINSCCNKRKSLEINIIIGALVLFTYHENIMIQNYIDQGYTT